MILLHNSRERTRFIRFSVVGAIGAFIDFTAFNLFYNLLHVPAVLASVLSFTSAVISNFVLNRFWTYPDSRSKSIGRQVVEFFIVNLVGLGIRTPVFVFSERLFLKLIGGYNFFDLTPEIISHNLGLATAIGVVLFWNFFVNRFWTYSDVE